MGENDLLNDKVKNELISVEEFRALYSGGYVGLQPSRHSKVFFQFASKDNKENILLPSNFDLDELLIKYPPVRYGFPDNVKFRKDRVYSFLSLISSIPARNNDLIDENGYVPIQNARLRKSDKLFTQYKNYLLETGIILTNGSYEVGVRSLGYKWSEQYATVPFAIRNVASTLADEVAQYEFSPDKKDYPYLFHWYEQKKLAINPLAEKYAYEVKKLKMEDSSKASWSINKDTGRLKDPIIQYYAALLNIGKLQRKQYEAHLDDNVHNCFFCCVRSD